MGAPAAALALHAALEDRRHMVPWQPSAAMVRSTAISCMLLIESFRVWHCGNLHPRERIAMHVQARQA